MKVEVGKILSGSEVYQLQKYLGKGRVRTATLVLYLACIKAFPKLNPDHLYKACWSKITTKTEKNDHQIKLIQT